MHIIIIPVIKVNSAKLVIGEISAKCIYLVTL